MKNLLYKVIAPFDPFNRFEHKTMSSVLQMYFCCHRDCGFNEMHIHPQISGDCRAFVSAEALFSSRFMIVVGSWQQLV